LKVIRLVVADDHPVVRAGLLGILSNDPLFEVVAVAADGTSALEHIISTKPDVALVDLRMPGIDGIRMARELRQRALATSILLLTTYAVDADIFAAVDAGASGYILKDATPTELFAAIRTVADGGCAFAPRIKALLNARAQSPGETLSVRELEVLRLVAAGESNKLIGAKLKISEATVKTHMLHIFAKLGVDDRTAAVTRAAKRGLLRLDIGL
jgi:DNA-binding NarL/FixJ family response regulator